MTLQKQVYEKQAIGVVGEFADSSPKRVASYIVKANSGVAPAIGCAFTYGNNENEVVIGGSGAFAGIVVGPKQYAAGTMTPSLALADGSVAQVCSMGHIYVITKTAASPEKVVAFNPANGEIYAYATTSAATAAGHTVIDNAKFVFSSAAANGVAIVELNP